MREHGRYTPIRVCFTCGGGRRNTASPAPAVPVFFPEGNPFFAGSARAESAGASGAGVFAARSFGSFHGYRAARKAQAGLTLIELMIVVVIVAILALIAYPSYEDHLRRGRRAAAQSFLMEVANREQQYLLDARGYTVGTGAIGALNLAVPGEVSKFYVVTVAPAAPTTPPSYTITATPIAGSAQVPDGVLTLDHDGAKTRNGQPGW